MKIEKPDVITTRIYINRPETVTVSKTKYVVLDNAGRVVYRTKPSSYFTSDFTNLLDALRSKLGFKIKKEIVLQEERNRAVGKFVYKDEKGYYIEVNTYTGDPDQHYEEVERVVQQLRERGLFKASQCRMMIIKEC